jgi:multiple epidermal growth factor-like domains protein 6
VDWLPKKKFTSHFNFVIDPHSNQATDLCECGSGFSGPRCEVENPCYAQFWPCLGDGVCDQGTGVCACNPPFFGRLCDGTRWCFEDGGECHNGGTCNERGWCECPEDPMIFGPACEKRADARVFGCENGGTYNETATECDCPEPFYGQLCSLVNTTLESNMCSDDNDCAAETTCNTISGVCDCGNTTRYGTLCEHTFDCSVNGCMNGGICNATTGICDCVDVFYGYDCSKVPDCTSDEDCYFGTCNTATGYCRCEYFSDFGKLCHIHPKCSRDGFCHNGGVCHSEGE